QHLVLTLAAPVQFAAAILKESAVQRSEGPGHKRQVASPRGDGGEPTDQLHLEALIELPDTENVEAGDEGSVSVVPAQLHDGPRTRAASGGARRWASSTAITRLPA